MNQATTLQESAIQWRARMLVAAQTAGLVAMMAVTYRLWFPVVGTASESAIAFPAIPVFAFIVGWSPVLGWVFSGGVIVFALLGCLCLLKSRWPQSRMVFCLVAAILIGSVLLNQHRFLPWVWQSLILFVGWGLLREKDFLRFSRVLVVTIYLYSAISKWDYQFVKSTGREILHALTGIVQVDSTNWPGFWIDWIVLVFPVAEFLIGIGLIFPTTRLFAMFGGMGMHLTLLAALGPFGLKNAESVLLWNMLFIIQLFLLYWPARIPRQLKNHREPPVGIESGSNDQAGSDLKNKPQKPSVRFVVMAALVCLFPLFEKINWIDHWPAWSLYAPQASRCRLYVPDWKVEQLPEGVQKYFGTPTGDFAKMREFNMGRWSLDELNAPIYPQDRFQFGVARYLVEKLKLQRTFEILLQSSANYSTGRRINKRFTTFDKLDDVAESEFLGNSKAYVAERPD